MKCPECGQWNRASLPRCTRCGCALSRNGGEPAWREELRDGDGGRSYIRVSEDGNADVIPDKRDQLAREMAELKERKAEGARLQRQLRRESARRAETAQETEVRTHATEESFASVGRKQLRTPVRVVVDGQSAARTDDPYAVQPVGSWNAGFDPLAENQGLYTSFTRTAVTPLPRLPSRSRRWKRVTAALLLVVLGGALALGGTRLLDWWQEHRGETEEESYAAVTATVRDDLAAHTILIPGEDGQQVYIRELHTSYIVQNGFATVEIADHTWYDDLEEVTEPTMNVTLTPFVKTGSGRQQPLDPITYEISIPSSPITLVTPDASRVEVATAMYSMQFDVRPGSKVYINDVDVSDTVNYETGRLTYNATVQPIGDNPFNVRVRSQYCRESSMLVTLYRAPQEIPLDLSADTYSTTSEKAIEIRATTLPGATVDVLTPHSDLNITKLDSTGAFSFMALLDHYGQNTIQITSSYPGKKTTLVEYQMNYVPTASVYTPKAWPLVRPEDYSELVSNITVRAANSQVYVVTGYLAYTVSDKPQMIVINASEDGTGQPVMLENQTRTTWVEGQYYRIFADAFGTYNGMPWLIARYTYTY